MWWISPGRRAESRDVARHAGQNMSCAGYPDEVPYPGVGDHANPRFTRITAVEVTSLLSTRVLVRLCESIAGERFPLWRRRPLRALTAASRRYGMCRAAGPLRPMGRSSLPLLSLRKYMSRRAGGEAYDDISPARLPARVDRAAEPRALVLPAVIDVVARGGGDAKERSRGCGALRPPAPGSALGDGDALVRIRRGPGPVGTGRDQAASGWGRPADTRCRRPRGSRPRAERGPGGRGGPGGVSLSVAGHELSDA